jgi:hypothetical protein
MDGKEAGMVTPAKYAVMNTRSESSDSLDFFPTPPWATRALCEHVIQKWVFDEDEYSAVWEPACGMGDMARTLGEYYLEVFATDIHNYGWDGQDGVFDFLKYKPDISGLTWVVTNPPFRLGEAFVHQALGYGLNVAMFQRTTFLETKGRYERLFKETPPSIIAQFSERVPIVKGRVDPNASSATAYCWMVWARDMPPDDGTTFQWIPPCRKELEKEDDYVCSEGSSGQQQPGHTGGNTAPTG